MKDKSDLHYRLAGKIFIKTLLGEMTLPVTVYKN
jgi:hypothetical protein